MDNFTLQVCLGLLAVIVGMVLQKTRILPWLFKKLPWVKK